MTRQQPFVHLGFHLLSTLLVLMAAQAFAKSALSDPCNRIRNDFSDQLRTIQERQKIEMQVCRATSSTSSDRCAGLKAQQKEELWQLKNERDYQLHMCERAPLTRGISLSNSNDCYTARQDYVDTYYRRAPGDDDHYKHPPSGNGGPGRTVNAGNGDGSHTAPRLPRDNDGASFRHDGSAASSSSGGGSRGGHSSSSVSSHSSGASGSSGGGSGGGYSGGGHSGGGASSSSTSSSSSSSSAASHDSGGGRPK